MSRATNFGLRAITCRLEARFLKRRHETEWLHSCADDRAPAGGPDPSHAECQRDLVVGLSKLAVTARAQGEREQACRHLQEALAIMRPLTEHFPEHPGFRRDLRLIEARLAAWGCGGPAAAGRGASAAQVEARRPNGAVEEGC